MKKLAVLLLAAALLLPAAALPEGNAAEVIPAAEETVAKLPDATLMTFFDGTMFVGDSQVAKFRNFVKKKWKEDPEYFRNIDFRAENSYKFRFAAYKTIPSGELKYAHITDGGKKVTLYALAQKKKPKRIFILAGINDALTTDRKEENGVDRAMRYVRGATELIREASPETAVYFITQMPVTKSYTQGSNRFKAVTERWNAINEAIAAESGELGITLVDLASGLKDEDGALPSEYCADGLCHLNDAGYEIFARELLDFAQAEYEAGRWIPGADADDTTGEEP